MLLTILQNILVQDNFISIVQNNLNYTFLEFTSCIPAGVVVAIVKTTENSYIRI